MCIGRKRNPAVQRRIIAVPASVAKPSGAPVMPLLQPSFRGRLRLFFAVIVIVPMIAVGVVLFQLLDLGGTYKLDSGLDQAQKTAKAIYEQDREDARDALIPFTKSRDLATAINNGQRNVVGEQLDRLARQTGAEWVKLTVDGVGTVETGDKTSIAAARAELQDAGGG